MQPTNELTPIQITFLDWITRGLSIEEAAEEIEQSWPTIIEWKRTIPTFRLALDEAFECRALLNRERAQELCHEALQVLLKVIRDEKASSSVRLRASLAIFKMATSGIAAKRNPAPKEQPKPESAENPRNVHNSAQVQPIRLPVTPGRNSVCPCGSGAKFKRCCGNAVPSTATAESAAA
jgi:uncharacterized protein YecA (UPF0149 family)